MATTYGKYGIPAAHKHTLAAGDGGALDTTVTYCSDLAGTLDKNLRTIQEMMLY